MSKIWFTSDWHFCHDKDFLWFPRGFDSIEMNNLAILSNHNLLVSNEDDVYVLGDLMLNDNEKGLELIKSMKGKLHIILGNHDTESRMELYSEPYIELKDNNTDYEYILAKSFKNQVLNILPE